MDTFNHQKLFQKLAENWPSGIVARTEFEKFSGGIYSRKYLANCDSKGIGPEGRFRVGRKICYPVQQLVEWLESRAQAVRGGLQS
jgi:hypothetical protein